LALSHTISGISSYWIYETNLILKRTTKEEFEKRITEAQYLCPERDKSGRNI